MLLPLHKIRFNWITSFFVVPRCAFGVPLLCTYFFSSLSDVHAAHPRRCVTVVNHWQSGVAAKFCGCFYVCEELPKHFLDNSVPFYLLRVVSDDFSHGCMSELCVFFLSQEQNGNADSYASLQHQTTFADSKHLRATAHSQVLSSSSYLVTRAELSAAVQKRAVFCVTCAH